MGWDGGAAGELAMRCVMDGGGGAKKKVDDSDKPEEGQRLIHHMQGEANLIVVEQMYGLLFMR
jgi:hypothetical protein